jgi:ABC-type Na+ efflux pump permease subunit
MLWTLLAKDLARFRRNPLPWLIFLGMPLLITALIGLAFGPRSGGESGMGRIRFAVVDEDDSPLTQFLRGGMNQAQGGKYLEPVFLDRAEALRQIQKNQLSAVVVLPAHFTRDYLTGRNHVTLELIKNPAQSIHPAILEELLGALVAGLNALARNFQPEFADWQALFEGQGDYRTVSELIRRGGDRLQAVKDYVVPPRVSYTKEERKKAGEPAKGSGGGGGPSAGGVFLYILPGLSAMFLLFLANTAMMDVHRELQNRTLQRFRTLHHRLSTLVVSKVVVAVVMLFLCGAIMMGGGSLIFRIHWQHPWAATALTAGFCLFAAGLLALLTALIPNQRRADTLNTLIAMAVALAGGCAFPGAFLPPFLRDHISPLLPTYWFVETIRNLELGNASFVWWRLVVGWTAVSAVLIGIATWLLRRRFEKGGMV